MTKLDKNYWDMKYVQGDYGWDTGGITAPLQKYFEALDEKDISILIPGCGNAYEAEHLLNNGFSEVYVMDWSETALKSFNNRNPGFDASKLLYEDFFSHTGKYDLIVEQTFFCAIERERRAEYAKKVFSLLNDGGKFIGVLFNHEFDSDNPPFGGTKQEYLKYFEGLFDIQVFEECYNSIKPRAGRELFFIMKKPH